MRYPIDRNTAKAAIKRRDPFADKSTVGALLSVCGSYGMAGAAIMSAKAALRSGVGLIKCAVPETIYPIMAQAVPEAVYYPVRDYKKLDINERLRYCSAVLVGCGIGTGDSAAAMVRSLVAASEVPVICDADALNIIAKNPDILSAARARLVLTPHDREFSRLCGFSLDEVKADREELAIDYAMEHKVVLVLKGHVTVVALPDGSLLVNDSAGNAGMAVGGSGDVLAGIIAGLTAQNPNPELTAPAGVYVHALAGDIARERLGELSMLPTDMIELLPEAYKSLKI